MIRYMYLALAGLFALAGIVYAVSAFLPAKYTTELRTEFNRTPDEVWAAVQNYKRVPMSAEMMRMIYAADAETNQPAWTEDIGASRVKITTLEQRPSAFLRRKLTDSTIPMSALVDIHLEPTDRGTLMRVKWETTVENGAWQSPVFRLLLSVTNSSRSEVEAYIFRLHSVLLDLGPVINQTGSTRAHGT